MAESPLLQRLEGLDARFDEIGTLITDPSVIADQRRYVKLTKEYKSLEEEYFLPPDSIDGGYIGLIHFSPAYSPNPDLIKQNCINIYIKPENLFSGDTSDVKYR